jgi:ubiquinone/menaquinone biosynthesis C-methylase UbiE
MALSAHTRARLLRLAWRLNGYDRSLRRIALGYLRPAGGVLVDLGGGSGRFTPWFAPRVERALIADAYVEGYEARANVARRLCRAYPNVAIVQTDAGSIALASGSVDYVFCAQLLEHVAEPEEVVREIARVLKPGGRAVVVTQDGDWLARYRFPIRRWLRPVYRPKFAAHPELNAYYYHGWEAWEREVGHRNRFPREFFARAGANAGLRTHLRHLRKRLGTPLLELELCFAEEPLRLVIVNALSAVVHLAEDVLPGRGFDAVACYERV